MKVGDIVTIRDRSYSTFIKNGKLMEVNTGLGPQFTVVQTNCRFAGEHIYQVRDNHWNNTVIQETGDGVTVFIEERFLKLAKHKIVIDDKTIEISNESYRALKKSLKDN